MKLLLDQNLSFKVVDAVADLFPGSAHVRDCGLDQAGDEAIWQLAQDRGFIIVSKDNDFQQRAVVLGHPPKVVWLKVGNCTTAAIIAQLRAHVTDLRLFESDQQAAFLILA